jgi:lysylphosphatidylglycerol synthetase-like protein (DUF2156 family)
MGFFMEQFQEALTQEERTQIVKLVRRWAGATTDAILDPSMQRFILPGISGFIAYRFESNSAIVFGDPTCAETDRELLTKAFHRFAEEQGKDVIYISASQSFAHWAIENGCSTLIEFGKELVIDPLLDPTKEKGRHGNLVRRKIRSAIRDKISVQEYVSHDAGLKRALEEVGEKWLRSRHGLQMHISNVYLFNDTEGKRWFYAKQGEQVVGVSCLNQLQKHRGWLFNHLMTLPDAPNGTSELLVTSALKTLNREGCRFVHLGIVTPKKLGVMVGLSRFSQWIAHLGFRIARMMAHLDGLSTFWMKFNPQEHPSYLLFSRKKIGIREVISLKKALSGKATKERRKI